MIRRISYRCGGALVTAAVECPDLDESVRRLFAPYETHEPAPTRQPDLRLRVTDAGFVLQDGTTPQAVATTAGEAIERFEFALTNALLRSRRDLAHLHASGTVIDGSAKLVLGGRGAGKSSLAVAWSVAGHSVLGDDIVFLRSDARAQPFRRLFKVDPLVLGSLQLDPTSTPFWEPGSTEAWFDPADAAGWAAEGDIDVVAIARHREGGTTELRQISAAEGLNALLASLMPSGLPASAAFSTLADIAGRTRFFRIEFADARDAAAALASV